MKRIRLFVIGLAAILVVFAMAADVSAQTAQNGIFKVVKIQGAARYWTTGNAASQPLKTGTILRPGTVIQTAANSYVDLVLNNPKAVGSSATVASTAPQSISYQPKAEQDAIRLFENTVLGVDKLTTLQTGADTVTETQLDLKVGRIFGTVKKLSASSKYEIKIPNGVAGIRGTIYFLDASGVLTVVSGSVLLAYYTPDGALVTQVVDAGQQFDSRTGQITSVPDSMLKDLLQLAHIFSLTQNMGPMNFTQDQTVFFVSPTHGRHKGPPFTPPGPPP